MDLGALNQFIKTLGTILKVILVISMPDSQIYISHILFTRFIYLFIYLLILIKKTIEQLYTHISLSDFNANMLKEFQTDMLTYF